MPSGCHEWRRGYYAPEKYGLLAEIAAEQIGERAAHRASYVIAHGAIPDGLLVRHTCDNPPCVNPEHLLTGTVRDNVQDRTDRGRTRGFGAVRKVLA